MSEETVKIDSLIRGVEDRRGSGELLNFGLSSTASTSFDIEDNDQVAVEVTLSHDLGLRIFALPQMTFYVSSVSNANKIYGSTYDSSQFTMYQWLDFQATDNNNVVLVGYLRNLTGSTQTILVRANWRFLVEDV